MAKHATHGTLSADGSTTAENWSGGRGLFSAFGTWGGGTLTFQFSPDGGTTWLPIAAGITADGFIAFNTITTGTPIRATLSGATTPSLTVTMTTYKPDARHP